MCREQPSSPGTPSPTSVKATFQQPTGQADSHAAAPQWSLGDFPCGRQRPSPVSASSMSSQHASETCSATADGKTSHATVHPAVTSSAPSVVNHSSAQQCSKCAGQDSVQGSPPQFCIADFGMRMPVPSRVQTPSMASIHHASGTGAKLPPQASASAIIPPASAKTAQISHTTMQMYTRPTAHDKRSLANNVAPKTSSQNGSQMSTKPQISTKPSQRQIAEEKASGSEQSAPVNSQATSDICTDPRCQLGSNQISLADDFPPLGMLRQPEQPAAKKSTRHSPIAHGASAHTHASSKKSANNKSGDTDAANKTSSTSLRAADPQVIAQATTASIKGPTTASKDATTARAFHTSSSDSSDEFHSASSDAAELRSSRLSPYSSPSQASTGSSYTTARSQTSKNSQAINHHSQLAGMTSAAAAPAVVSSSSQGFKQASMACTQVPVPLAEQRHNANAERGQVSQVGQHSSRPPIRSQTAQVEPEQPQAERHYKPQRVHQYQHPSQALHLASAEHRQYAQAERDHGSRPLDRVRSVTAEPGHDAQAEHQSRTQGCKSTSRPYISPQTVNIEPLKDVPAECDSMPRMHPGLGSGVDPSDPSNQAGLEESVHSLDDALSNALQELLLTEDRQDFVLSVQVCCNMKHICFLHTPQKTLVISFVFLFYV